MYRSLINDAKKQSRSWYQSSKQELMIRITKNAVSMIGTSANLIYGHWIRLIDLLYALMLPSGNDAAYLLAEAFGLLLFYSRLKNKEKSFQDIQSIDLTCYQSTNHFVTQFIKSMNKKARQLNLVNTSFCNPHGLSSSSNYSSAKDILQLSKFCKNNLLFMQISSTKQYKANIYEDQYDQQGYELYWRNTNKLLNYGWEGIKTGQTQTAGCCLASVRDGIFIIVLNSQDTQKRFEDTVNIWQWYMNYHKKNLRETEII